MTFKMKGSPMQYGTAAHKSALKIKSIEARKQEVAAAGQASASGEASASPAKETKTYKEAGVSTAKGEAMYKKAKTRKSGAQKYKASPTKETDWEAMHAKAKEKYNRYDNLTTEQYKAEAQRQMAHYKKTGKWDAGGVYNHDGSRVDGGSGTTSATDETTKTAKTNEGEKRVKKDSYSAKTKEVYRKSGKLKKKVTKDVSKDEDGKLKTKEVSKYRKDGSLKTEKYKEKDTGHYTDEPYKTKKKTKYDKQGNVKKEKTVTKEGGRRTVKTTDAEGNVKTRSRRTLKGILTGKGKLDKDEKKNVK